VPLKQENSSLDIVYVTEELHFLGFGEISEAFIFSPKTMEDVRTFVSSHNYLCLSNEGRVLVSRLSTGEKLLIVVGEFDLNGTAFVTFSKKEFEVYTNKVEKALRTIEDAFNSLKENHVKDDKEKT
jgi:hypothetical protein